MLMKTGLTEKCYRVYSALANPTRLAILERLNESDMNVTQLTEALGQEQSMISHNLKSLLKCQLVYSKREGKSRIYSLNRNTIDKLFEIVMYHAQNHCQYNSRCEKRHLLS